MLSVAPANYLLMLIISPINLLINEKGGYNVANIM